MYKWMRDDAKISIGLNHLDRGNGQDAIRHFNECIKNEPDNPKFYFWRGTVYRQLVPRHKCEYHTVCQYGQAILTDESKEHLNQSIKDLQKAQRLYEEDQERQRKLIEKIRR